MNNRISKDDMFLRIAWDCAMRSTCLQRKYGAVIVNDGYIISTGYNGAPRGVDDCIRIGSCWRKTNKIPSGENYERCMSVHAEMNAIVQAGKDAKGATMYLSGYDVETKSTPENMMPCSLCTKLLINSQIKEVVMLQGDIHKNPLKYEILIPLQIWDIRVKEILS